MQKNLSALMFCLVIFSSNFCSANLKDYYEVAKRVQREEAMEMGFAEGRAAGMAAGRIEEKIEMVKNLLTTNLPLKEIARVVGWSEEKILQLAEKN